MSTAHSSCHNLQKFELFSSFSSLPIGDSGWRCFRPLVDTGHAFVQGIPFNAKGRAWDVDLTSRFAAYATIGWVVVSMERIYEKLGW